MYDLVIERAAEKDMQRLSSVVHGRVSKAIAEWIETARSLNRPVPEPRGKLAYA